jgi:hypothetical protein
MAAPDGAPRAAVIRRPAGRESAGIFAALPSSALHEFSTIMEIQRKLNGQSMEIRSSSIMLNVRSINRAEMPLDFNLRIAHDAVKRRNGKPPHKRDVHAEAPDMLTGYTCGAM